MKQRVISTLYFYRLLLVMLIFLTVSCIFNVIYIKPNIAIKKKLEAKLIILSTEQNRVRNKMQTLNKKKTSKVSLTQKAFREQIMQDIRMYFLKSGIALSSLSFLSTDLKQPHRIIIAARGEGTFAQVQHFLLLLFNWQYLNDVESIELRANETGLISFAIDASLLERYVEAPISREKHLMNHNPFCSGQMQRYALPLSEIPFEQWQLVGCLANKAIQQAFFKLPDGTVKLVTTNEFMGKEKIKLIKIEPERILVQFPNHHRQLIKLRS